MTGNIEAQSLACEYSHTHTHTLTHTLTHSHTHTHRDTNKHMHMHTNICRYYSFLFPTVHIYTHLAFLTESKNI